MLCVVDGANDVKLFDICGLGIAYRAQDLVKDLATTTLEEKDLSKIIDIINKHYKLELEAATLCINNFFSPLKQIRYLEIIPIHIEKEIEPSDDLADLLLDF